MGKLFSFAEIQQGMVPNRDDFRTAKTTVMHGLKQAVTDGEILGGLVYGSVAKGTPSERSDFDLLVITPSEKHPEVFNDLLNGIFYATRISIEPVVIPEDLARKGIHTIDESFYLHLKNSTMDENIAGQNPTDMLVPYSMPLIKVHEQYLAQKMRRLREGMFTHSETDKLRVLQRALEAPINTGRRTLQAFHALGVTNELPDDDGKGEVINSCNRLFKDSGLINNFNTLLFQDAYYTELLRETVKKNIREEEYNREINELSKTAVPAALQWCHDIATLYSRLLEGANPNTEGKWSTYTSRERL